MKRLALVSAPLILVTAPAIAADLDGPDYSYRPPAPPPRVVEHYHYYVPAPRYVEEYDEDVPVYRYYGRPYYNYTYWYPRHHFRHHHRHNHGGRW
jgi:hypothetical protein